MKQLQPTDYVVYNKRVNYPLCFSNGDIIIYNDEEEAEEDCLQFELVIRATELPQHLQEKLLKQINKNN